MIVSKGVVTIPERFAVIIAGSRTFADYNLLCEKCDFFFQNKRPTSIVCGKARGADTLGEQYAVEHQIPVDAYPAQWDKHGKAAGYIRNEEMAKNADALIAFWDGKSRGTKHMIDLAMKYQLKIRIVYYE